MNSKYENMSLKEIIRQIEKKDKRIAELEKKVSDMNDTINERYQERLTEVLYKGEIKNCSTCKNNVKFPPSHTCDICTSLDQEEEYEMWEERIEIN